MTKQILKFISTFVVIVMLFTTFVSAENEVDTNNIITTEVENSATNSGEANETMPISTENGEQTANEEATNTADGENAENTAEGQESIDEVPEVKLTKGDVYLVGEDVIVNDTIDGNLFVIGNNVTINSQVGGDAFIIANSVTVTDQGYVYSNLFTCADKVEVKGVIYDLYALSHNITISGYVYRDARVSCGNLNIFGTVGRSVYANVETIKFSEETTMSEEGAQTVGTQGTIGGDLNYSANEELSIPEGVVTGMTSFSRNASTNGNNIVSYVLSLGAIVATAIIIWLLGIWLTPKFIENTNNVIKKKILPVIGFGILTPLVAIIASIILMLIGITAPIGFILLGLLFILMAISTSVFIIAINNLVCGKLNISKKIGIFGMLILTSIVIWAIGLIPYVGSILSIVALVIGLGLIITPLVLKDKSESSESKKENKKEEK